MSDCLRNKHFIRCFGVEFPRLLWDDDCVGKWDNRDRDLVPGLMDSGASIGEGVKACVEGVGGTNDVWKSWGGV